MAENIPSGGSDAHVAGDPHPEIIDRLARIETKLDIGQEKFGDQEKRLRNVEKELWLHRGAAAVVGILATLATKYWPHA